jgi:hypothetical protein
MIGSTIRREISRLRAEDLMNQAERARRVRRVSRTRRPERLGQDHG